MSREEFGRPSRRTRRSLGDFGWLLPLRPDALVLAALISAVPAFSGQAQEPPKLEPLKQDLLRPETPRPTAGIVIGSPDQRPRGGTAPCVEVEIGGVAAPPLDCLNKKLKNQVDRVQPPANNPPLDAKSQDIRVGVTNAAAVRQQYGANFGVSPFPQRPGAPTFVNPAGRR
jgi:hypothetical protein